LFDAKVIIHGPLNPLLAAEIPFRCLHGNVAQKELDLLQFAACGMAQLCARAAKIMRSESRKTEFLRVLFHHVPDHPPRLVGCSEVIQFDGLSPFRPFGRDPTELSKSRDGRFTSRWIT
jgi:hypothetical protein